MSDSSKSTVRFCKHNLSFTAADVARVFSKVPADTLTHKRYYVAVGGRKISVPEVLERCAGVKLVWAKNPDSGVMVGTYSTRQGARALARLGLPVYDSTTGKRVGADALKLKPAAK